VLGPRGIGTMAAIDDRGTPVGQLTRAFYSLSVSDLRLGRFTIDRLTLMFRR